MKKILPFLFLLLMASPLWADSWIDVTENFLANPRYDNDSKAGWNISASAGSTNCSWGCQEFWNGTYDMYQTITGLPNGVYRIGVQAFYRYGSNYNAYHAHQDGTENLSAVLYANDEEVPLNSVFAKGYEGGYSDCVYYDGMRYPNAMYSACFFFNSLGYYHNTLQVTVTDHQLTIGSRNYSYLNDNWAIFDNWTLEYYGEAITLSDLKLEQTSLTMSKGEQQKLTFTQVPEYVTNRDIRWASDNEAVAVVDADGVVSARLRGTATITCRDEISGASASCQVIVQSVELTSENVIINEIQPRNIDMFVDPSYNYGGWVELYNPTDVTVDLGGCHIRDEQGNDFKFSYDYGYIPAHGYKNVWFDHNSIFGKVAYKQVWYKLNVDGGTITIVNEVGEDVASVTYPATIGRTSYARLTDGGKTWGITARPTPEASNDGCEFASVQLDAPSVDKDGCLFTEGFTVQVDIPDGATLRYTTNGSTPTWNNGFSSKDGQFTVENTMIYRFRLFQDGYLPSEVVTRSYIFKSQDYNLPIVSVVTDSANLYDDMIGCYVRGTNGKSGNGVTGTAKANWNMDWDRPVNFEYLNEEGNMAFAQEVDFNISGGWSRRHFPKSFKLKASKMYGINDLQYQWFDSKPYNKYKQLLIRNGGNDDNANIRFKDAALQEIVRRSGLNAETQAWRSVLTFLNGRFVGMMNMREIVNRQYGYSNYGMDTDLQDAFEMSVDSGYVQVTGTKKMWDRWYELSKNAWDDEVYKQICEIVDIDNLVNYMAVQINLDNWDWPHNNMKGYRSQEDGKFHFVIFDLDNVAIYGSNAMNDFRNQKSYTYYPIYNEDGTSYNITAEVEFVTMILNMLENEQFTRRLIDACCMVNGSVFEPERCREVINEMQQVIEPAMDLQGLGYKVSNMANSMRGSFSTDRQSSFTTELSRYFGRYNTQQVSLESRDSQGSEIEDAKILVNDMEVPTGRFGGQLFGPVTVKAIAPAGYRFLGWEGETTASELGETNCELISWNDSWSYYDKGSQDGTNWNKPGYDDSNWVENMAPFGYNVRNGYPWSTTLDYGENSSDKRPTYYFRKTFQLDRPLAEIEDCQLSVSFDDGYIIYINGVEVAKRRLSSGATYSDYAWEYGGDPFDTDVIMIDKALLKAGENLIAVELHNQSATSSDVYFDAELQYALQSEHDMEYVSRQATFTLEENETYSLTARYEKIDVDSKRWEAGATPIRINEVSAGNEIYVNEHFKKNDWVELYNTTDNAIDLAGMYLSDNAKKPQKWQICAGQGEASTVIPAHGTKIIWCDQMEAVTQLHAPFKLDNADGASISIQAEDGRWADAMTYLAQGNWETYGRYPDGGNYEALLKLPTIDKSNKQILDNTQTSTPDFWQDDEISVTLALAEGWNWSSHNLQSTVHPSRFMTYAQTIRGQEQELFLDEDLGWQGLLNSLDAATGYKVQMKQPAEITLRGVLYDPTDAVTVKAGWNWVGFPLYNATMLATAMENYTPCDGDRIVGMDAFAVWSQERGEWIGSLTTLVPGQAYLLKAGRTQTFAWNALSTGAGVKQRRYAPAMHEDQDIWALNIHAYPNVMTLVGEVQADDIDLSGNCRVGIFCGDECRGIAKLDEGVFYMNIHGEGGEKLTFRLLDNNGDCFISNLTVKMQDMQQLGSVEMPYLLPFCANDVDDIMAVAPTSDVIVSQQYYNMAGLRIARPEQGICIQKTVYENGKTESKVVRMQ